MSWDGRLEGGPYDGDAATIFLPERPPTQMLIMSCGGASCRLESCDGTERIHWIIKGPWRGEPYRRDREEDGVWIFVYDQLNVSGPVCSERELVPA